MAKILVMDDEPGLRNVVTGMLKPTGHTLFVTEDGTQAIETAKREKPDLALLDMRVPDMDGLEVVSHLKQMDPRIQCIMLSGFGDVESAVSAMKQGAFDYISKPFKLEEVLRVVNKALSIQASAPASPAQTAAPGPASHVQSEPAQKATSGSKKNSTTPLLIGLGMIIVGLAGFFGWKFLGSAGKPISFSVPYNDSSAIAWNGTNLFVADWASQSVYRHQVDKTLSIQNVYSLSGIHPTGLAWDGDNLWSCSAMEKKITKHNNDSTLSAIVNFPNPLEEPAALGWDGVHLWCADGAGGQLYKLKPVGEGMNIAGVYEGVASNPVGIFFKDNSLWVADGESGKIYKQNINNLSVLGIYSLEPYASKMDRFSGMTYDGEFLWTCAQSSGKVYKHEWSHLKKITP